MLHLQAFQCAPTDEPINAKVNNPPLVHGGDDPVDAETEDKRTVLEPVASLQLPHCTGSHSAPYVAMPLPYLAALQYIHEWIQNVQPVCDNTRSPAKDDAPMVLGVLEPTKPWNDRFAQGESARDITRSNGLTQECWSRQHSTY